MADLTQKPFQDRVYPWMQETFGPKISADTMERNHRFFEEAAELVQACGMTASEAHQLLNYTFGRPIGEKYQEVGGVMVTLAALCLAQGLDMHAEGERELSRILAPEIMAKIRAKQAAKPKHSPLPEKVEQSEETWKCFHCGETFSTQANAELHFGSTQYSQAACQIDVTKFREMEKLVARYQEEDTDLHREIYALQAKHHLNLQREEEKGYARGLNDARKEQADGGPMFYVRIRSDGGYEGPIHADKIEQVRIDAGWTPLHVHPAMRLSDEEIHKIWGKLCLNVDEDVLGSGPALREAFARAIEKHVRGAA